jgi:hypothetical protein
MVFRPQDFRSALQFDGARPNRFKVTMNFPPNLTLALRSGGGDGLNVQEKFQFMCRSAQIPGSTVNLIPVYYQGREIKVPGDRVFDVWTVTVMNDEDFKVRNALELWMNELNSHAGNSRSLDMMNSADYSVDAFVTQLSKSEDTGPLKSYKFVGLWPTDLSPIDLDWGSQDIIQEYSVTFAYQWWEVNVGDADGTGESPPIRNVPIS